MFICLKVTTSCVSLQDKGKGKAEEPAAPAEPEPEKKKKPWRPPRKPKPETVDKQYFDSWVMTPTHIYKENNDMFYRNRQNVSEMWNSLARSIKKTVVDNSDRVQAYDRGYY